MRDLVRDAVDSKATRANWTLISTICERAEQSYSDAKTVVSALESTLRKGIPMSIHLCIAVAGTMVHNCNDEVKKLIFSRPFLKQLALIIMSRNVPSVTKQLCHEFIHRWAQEVGDMHDFRYVKIVRDELEATSIVYKAPESDGNGCEQKAPEQERQDIELAIAMSLSEAQKMREEQQPVLFRARSMYKYDPRDEGDLGLNIGDMIDVIDTTTYTQWWKGRIEGREGFFPSNFVEVLKDTGAQASEPELSHGHFVEKAHHLLERLCEADTNNSASIVKDPEVRRTFLEIIARKSHIVSRLSAISNKIKTMTFYLKTVDEFVDLCTKCVNIKT